jgi:hypothetical protein
MPFFFGGKTKCSICNQVIDHRHEAAILPYADPSTLGSVAKLSRSFVHRKCWARWEHARNYSVSSFDLAIHSSQTRTPISIMFAEDELIMYRVPALKGYRLQDFSLLVILELPVEFEYGLVDFFKSALSNTDLAGSYSCKSYDCDWRFHWNNLNDLELELFNYQHQEIMEKFSLPFERKGVWLSALGTIPKQAECYSC